MKVIALAFAALLAAPATAATVAWDDIPDNGRRINEDRVLIGGRNIGYGSSWWKIESWGDDGARFSYRNARERGSDALTTGSWSIFDGDNQVVGMNCATEIYTNPQADTVDCSLDFKADAWACDGLGRQVVGEMKVHRIHCKTEPNQAEVSAQQSSTSEEALAEEPVAPTVVPLPAGAVLLFSGLAGLGLLRRGWRGAAATT